MEDNRKLIKLTLYTRDCDKCKSANDCESKETMKKSYQIIDEYYDKIKENGVIYEHKKVESIDGILFDSEGKALRIKSEDFLIDIKENKILDLGGGENHSMMIAEFSNGKRLLFTIGFNYKSSDTRGYG